MRVITKDGAVFKGEPHEIVKAMRASNWNTGAYSDNLDFKRAVASRAKQWNGAEVRTEDDREWLADLEQAGLLSVEETP